MSSVGDVTATVADKKEDERVITTRSKTKSLPVKKRKRGMSSSDDGDGDEVTKKNKAVGDDDHDGDKNDDKRNSNKHHHLDSIITQMKQLLTSGADPYAFDTDGDTFLHNMTTKYSTLTPGQFHELTVHLIELGHAAVFNVLAGNNRNTVLQRVVRSKFFSPNVETLSLLAKSGVDFNAVDKRGLSVLGHAVKKKRGGRFIEKLVEFGGDPGVVTRGKGSSLLHLAADDGYVEGVKCLIGLGVDVNGKDLNGDTPIHRAVVKGKFNVVKIVEELAKGGGDVRIVNGKGEDAFAVLMGCVGSRNTYPGVKGRVRKQRLREVIRGFEKRLREGEGEEMMGVGGGGGEAADVDVDTNAAGAGANANVDGDEDAGANADAGATANVDADENADAGANVDVDADENADANADENANVNANAAGENNNEIEKVGD